jgi:glycosyltransferase involved in cell wall biosynthesis
MAEPARLCIYIPSFNARPFLRGTVERIPWEALRREADPSLLFIDNASTDGTQTEIARVREELTGAGIRSEAILHETNRGYGGSVKTALDWSAGRNFDYLAVLHADGQYAPEALPDLLARLRASEGTALYFGSRLTGDPLRGGMPFYKFAANHVLSGLQNLVLHARLSEYHSGYRLYRLALMKQVPYRRLSDGFVFDNQIIYQILHCRFGIEESAIATHYGDEKSNVPRLGTPLAILTELGRFALHRSGLKRSSLYEKETEA